MYSKPRPQKDSRRAEYAGFFGSPPPPPPSAQDVSEPRSRTGWVSPARSIAAQPHHSARRPPHRTPGLVSPFLQTVRDPPTQPREKCVEDEKGTAEGHPGSRSPASTPFLSPQYPEPPRLPVLSLYPPIRVPPATAARSPISEQQYSPPVGETSPGWVTANIARTWGESCHICSLAPWNRRAGGRARAHTHSHPCPARPEKTSLDGGGTVFKSLSTHSLRPTITLLQLRDPLTLPRHPLGSATDRRKHTPSERLRARRAGGGSAVCARRRRGAGQLGKKSSAQTTSEPTDHQPTRAPTPCSLPRSGGHGSAPVPSALQPAGRSTSPAGQLPPAPPRPPRVFARRQSGLFQVLSVA
ncbi:proline-rich protein 36 [Macaca thibetana thibetana]|uniref:proline-rich protein 36 n=1 Tax=Macaca thibetana thibetana TaxID=257877 RepID=UPI0021BCF2CB|nr:proline-rich protein 36 [Macaca thibetana thibetana]